MTISIITVAYNNRFGLEDTIKSVIEKTLPDFSKAVVEEAAKE